MNQSPPLRGRPVRWILLVGAVLLLLLVFLPSSSGLPEIEISQVVQMAQDDRLAKIQIQGDRLTVTTTDGEAFSSRKESGVSWFQLLDQRGVDVAAHLLKGTTIAMG